MKHLFLIIVMAFSVIATASPEKTRKVSNSNYFQCWIERAGDDSRVFRRHYLFPFPTEKDETYEIKGSLRWNNYKVIFSDSGKVQIKIDEMITGKKVHAEKVHQMGKDAQFDSFKVQLELKNGEKVVPYQVQCGPE